MQLNWRHIFLNLYKSVTVKSKPIVYRTQTAGLKGTHLAYWIDSLQSELTHDSDSVFTRLLNVHVTSSVSVPKLTAECTAQLHWHQLLKQRVDSLNQNDQLLEHFCNVNIVPALQSVHTRRKKRGLSVPFITRAVSVPSLRVQFTWSKIRCTGVLGKNIHSLLKVLEVCIWRLEQVSLTVS